MTWLTALTAWPAPIGPTWVIVRAHRRQDGARALDVRRVATDEDRQGAFLRALAPARDRRVDHPQAALGETRREVPAARRRDGRAVDDERSGRRALDDAAGPEQDRLDVGRVRHADDCDVDAGDRVRRALGERDPELGQLRGAAGRPVPADDLEARRGPGWRPSPPPWCPGRGRRPGPGPALAPWSWLGSRVARRFP